MNDDQEQAMRSLGWDPSWGPMALAGDTVADVLREALRTHHPIMRSETGPFSGCRCGEVKLGQDVIAHVVDRIRAALDPSADDVFERPPWCGTCDEWTRKVEVEIDGRDAMQNCTRCHPLVVAS